MPSAISGGALLYLVLKRSLSFESTLPRMQMTRSNTRRMQKVIGSNTFHRRSILFSGDPELYGVVVFVVVIAIAVVDVVEVLVISLQVNGCDLTR